MDKKLSAGDRTQIRHLAISQAIDISRIGGAAVNADDVLKDAKKIEAYLSGSAR